jgi:hypothetical protein
MIFSMKKKSLVVIVVTGFLFNVFADGLQGNYYADINQELLVMPQSAAMAGSDIALSRSASPLSNPANLVNDSIKETSVAYANYFENTYSTCGMSFIGPIDDRSSFGVSMSYVLVPDIMITDPNNPFIYPDRTNTSSDLFFRVSYGRKLYEFSDRIQLCAGFAINGERRDLDNWTGYGIGTDFGADVVFKNINAVAAVVVQNITGSYADWSQSYQEFAYPHVRFGLGWQPEFPYIYGKLGLSYMSPDLLTNEGINTYSTGSMSIDSSSDQNSLSYASPDRQRVYTNPLMLFAGCWGFEYTMLNTVSFRVGLDGSTMNFTFGGGLNLLKDHVGIDFAYLTNELAPTYKICMNFRWL